MKLIPTFEMAVAKNSKKELDYKVGDVIKTEYGKMVTLHITNKYNAILKDEDGYLVKGKPNGGTPQWIFDTPDNREKYKEYLTDAELVPFLDAGDVVDVFIGYENYAKGVQVIGMVDEYTRTYIGKYGTKFMCFSISLWVREYKYEWADCPADEFSENSRERYLLKDGITKRKLVNKFGKQVVDDMIKAGYKAA